MAFWKKEKDDKKIRNERKKTREMKEWQGERHAPQGEQATPLPHDYHRR